MAKLALASILALSTQSFFLINPKELDSANLTVVADTLSTSRLSYYDALTSLHIASTTLVSVTSTGNLFTGDTVMIGDTADATSYTVDDIYSTTQFTTTSGLDGTDIQANDVVIATRSATHTVTFTPATSIANGAFRILIPSGANANNDGIPNHDGFDFATSIGVGATAPTGGGVTSWETATATASAGTGCSSGNHCFEARYNGTNANSGTFTFYINGLINPSPDHVAPTTTATADTYTVTIQHLANRTQNYAVIDSTTVKIALIESVRVTATVDPTITFTLAAVGLGSTACGATTDVASTATTVPFGTMALNTFKNLAQKLTVSTNAVGGYAVTNIENDQLGKDGGTTTYIADATGDGAMTHETQDDWHTATQNGFGYSLQNADAATTVFQYSDTSGGSCTTGTFCAKQFAATADTDTAQSLFSSTTVANAEDVYACYRLSIGATQAAGDYENNITYTVTATF